MPSHFTCWFFNHLSEPFSLFELVVDNWELAVDN